MACNKANMAKHLRILVTTMFVVLSVDAFNTCSNGIRCAQPLFNCCHNNESDYYCCSDNEFIYNNTYDTSSPVTTTDTINIHCQDGYPCVAAGTWCRYCCETWNITENTPANPNNGSLRQCSKFTLSTCCQESEVISCFGGISVSIGIIFAIVCPSLLFITGIVLFAVFRRYKCRCVNRTKTGQPQTWKSQGCQFQPTYPTQIDQQLHGKFHEQGIQRDNPPPYTAYEEGPPPYTSITDATVSVDENVSV
ncbi:uncharacterized protein LOC117111639 [Anneissia japonica]|uniref:uncharacterized protein LOC117111639 n=1 Tax=Anneissia japonica TaxID=1529436 RepID=UPI0014258014|nr:uncharacterized protein LOC117111639 [Anneissia japonica]